MTFNTLWMLELILEIKFQCVLNLVINGWPSIQEKIDETFDDDFVNSFKPCYKWMTFNT